ncbi:MAG TPA: hypothetical protein VF426_11280, partial [Marmoricola sp.]
HVSSSTHHDSLAVHGAATLRGTLTVVDKNRTHPTTGAKVHGAVSATSRTGRFAHVRSKSQPKKHAWRATYRAAGVDLFLK